MLVLTRKPGQSFHIGESITVTITEISGDKVKIGIEAPRALQILRDELIPIIDSNRAAMSNSDNAAVHSLAASLKGLLGGQPPSPKL